MIYATDTVRGKTVERLSTLTDQLKNPPPGRLMARYLKAYIGGGGIPEEAAAYAKSMRWAEADRLGAIFKAGVGAMNTGEPMAQGAVAHDLIALTQPLTVIGRLQGFKRVPNGVNAIARSNPRRGFCPRALRRTWRACAARAARRASLV